MPDDRVQVDCPHCRVPGTRRLDVVDQESRESFEVHACPRCTLQYLGDPPAPERIGEYYASAQGSAMRTSPGRLFAAMRSVRIARDLAPLLREVPAGGRVADFGTGDGSVARHCLAKGRQVKAVDVYPAEAWPHDDIPYEQYVPTGGLPPGLLEVSGRPADGVVLRHVLEHLYDPAQFLTDLRTAGVRLVTAVVPNVESRLARRTGRHWYYWDPPRHLTFFGPETLRRLVEGAGYDVVALRHYGIDEVVSSVHRKLLLEPSPRLGDRAREVLVPATRPTGLLAGLSSAASAPLLDGVLHVLLRARPTS